MAPAKASPIHSSPSGYIPSHNTSGEQERLELFTKPFGGKSGIIEGVKHHGGCKSKEVMVVTTLVSPNSACSSFLEDGQQIGPLIPED